MSRSAIVIGMAVLVVGCASGPRRVSEGWLQKRQHRPGWHLDLARREASHAERRAPGLKRLELRSPELRIGEASSARRPLSSHRQLQPEDQVRSASMVASEVVADVDVMSVVVERGAPYQEDLMPRKRWNRLAVPAFVVSLGAVALALFTTSTIAVIAALVVAMVLAGISIRQIRWREEGGKGFAMAALMIAVIAAIVTAMVTAVVGFV